MTQPEVTVRMPLHVYYMNTSASFHLSWMKTCLRGFSHCKYREQPHRRKVISILLQKTHLSTNIISILLNKYYIILYAMFSIYKEVKMLRLTALFTPGLLCHTLIHAFRTHTHTNTHRQKHASPLQSNRQ